LSSCLKILNTNHNLQRSKLMQRKLKLNKKKLPTFNELAFISRK
jgi:hypothetical protein